MKAGREGIKRALDLRAHWNEIYSKKQPTEVSWYEPRPAPSLDLIHQANIAKSDPIIDVGAGSSTLIDSLLAEGYTSLTALDISCVALQTVKDRLGPKGADVRWVEADVTEFVPGQTFSLWHDRAVFHFLVRPIDRMKYREVLTGSLAPGGHAVIATFALDGPAQCSGLPVARYDALGLSTELGPSFELITSLPHTHLTPWNAGQSFLYCHFRKRAAFN
ncbi:MAG: class I SAM-dependent methyltransferase [Chloroflexi bacterium]|nr:class I SAM-dependent methyltransferase [Chloroflexota bacterium]